MNLIDAPCDLFPDGEVFVSTAEYDLWTSVWQWRLPGILHSDFRAFLLSLGPIDPEISDFGQCLRKFFLQVLGLDDGFVEVRNSVGYRITKKVADFDSNTICNLTEEHLADYQDVFGEQYRNKSQMSTAYLVQRKLVSVAFDNCNRTISVVTLPEFRNLGFGTACVRRLIYEYGDSFKELRYATTIENIPARRLAERCGMRKDNVGYWIAISKEIGHQFHDSNRPLFELRK